MPLKYAKLSETTNSQKKNPPNIYTNLNSPNENVWIKKKEYMSGERKDAW